MNRPAFRKVFLCAAVLWMVWLAAYSTVRTFFSVLGPVVVDYWAFAAGIFLAGEGLWHLMRSAENHFRLQMFRILRIGIGVSIFTIHFLQFVRDGKLGG